jgi:uncharacterized protein (TIGR03118 family)
MLSFLSKLLAPFQPSGVRRRHSYRPQVEAFEDRLVPTGGFTLVNLASSVPGQYGQYVPNLLYPQSFAIGVDGQVVVVADYLTERFSADGSRAQAGIYVPPYPYGSVYNNTSGFLVEENGISAPAEFLFASEYGGIYGYAPTVDANNAIAVVNPSYSSQFIYIALGTDAGGQSFLFVNDEIHNVIEVFDENFQQVSTGANAFRDPSNQFQYQYPFAINVVGDHVYIGYSLFSYDQVEEIQQYAIDEFNFDGTLVKSIPLPQFSSTRLFSNNPPGLNQLFPTGFAIAPPGFGSVGNDLLVSTYQGGVNVYSVDTGAFLGTLTNPDGSPFAAPHLESIAFAPDVLKNDGDALYFLASDNQGNGIFGEIEALPYVASPAPSAPTTRSTVLPPFAAPNPTTATTAPPAILVRGSLPEVHSSILEFAPTVVFLPADSQGPGSYPTDVSFMPSSAPAANAAAPNAATSPPVAVVGPDSPYPVLTDPPPTVPVDSDKSAPAGNQPMPSAIPEQSTSIDVRRPSETRLGAMPIVAAVGAGSYLARPGKANRERKRRRQMSGRR